MLRVRRRKYTSNSVAARATARVAPTRFETHSAFQTTIYLSVKQRMRALFLEFLQVREFLDPVNDWTKCIIRKNGIYF